MAAGSIYAWGSGGKGQKFAYSPTLGSATTFANFSPTDLQIAFDSSGNLWGLNINGQLYSVNTSTGADTLMSATVIVWDDGGINKTLTNFEDAASGYKTPGPTPEPITVGLGIAGLALAARRIRAK